MPKIAKELRDVEVKRLTWGVVKDAGKAQKRSVGDPCTAYHAVGGVSGLLLQCRPPLEGKKVAPRSWILRVVVGGKRRDIGLGGYPEVSLTKARERAKEIKDQIFKGTDPVLEKRAARSALIREQAKTVTFDSIAKEYIEKKSKEFKSAKQVYKLRQQIETYAYPYIGKMVIADIERVHIQRILKPIWEIKNETAQRVRLHVERILDLAGVKGLRAGDNPARWKGNLELSFPNPSKVSRVQHHAALPVEEMPAFLEKLKAQEWTGARLLELLIYTAARPGEARGATWDEIDLDAKLWTIPAERMKAGKAHRIPLSKSAIALLKSLPRLGKHVFTSTRGGPLTDATVGKAPKRIGYDVTAHGFRSTFKDWARKHTAYADEVSELALAHVGSDSTRAAYARDELLDKRRRMMGDWDKFCNTGLALARVVSIGAKKQRRDYVQEKK